MPLFSQAMSMDPAPNITADFIGDRGMDNGSIEDKWSGLDEGPVRKIPWIDLKTLTGAQKKEVFLKGTFPRNAPSAWCLQGIGKPPIHKS